MTAGRSRVVVVDTSILATTGLPTLVNDVRVVTISLVVKELQERFPDKFSLLSGVLGSRVEVFEEVDARYIDRVVDKARETMDIPRLSETDIKLAALALKFSIEGHEVEVLTNDLALQNVCRYLGLKAVGTISRIRHKIRWRYYCPACRTSFEKTPDGNTCPVCGSRVKYKPVTRQR